MFFTRLALNRSITTSMIFVIIIILATLCLFKIPVSFLPNNETPKLTITTVWNEVTSQIIEEKITSVIEEQVQAIPGIIKIDSKSTASTSIISIEFNKDTKIKYAKFLINEKINQIRHLLPENTYPQINESEFDDLKKHNFLKFAISGNYPTNVLRDYVHKNIVKTILKFNEVSNCDFEGVSEINYEISFLPQFINLINFNNIANTINRYGYKYSFSNADINNVKNVVIINSMYTSPENIMDIFVTLNNGDKYRLKNIATIKTVQATPHQIYRLNGEPQICLNVNKKSTANVIKLANKIKDKIADNKHLIPNDIKISLIEDESTEISKELNILYTKGIYTLIIILIILLLFLSNIYSTFIVGFSIILSVMLSILMLYICDIGLNMLSLAGLTLGLGLIVDNSIVVYENICGVNKEDITKKISKLYLPLFASTITTVIVFVPFIFASQELKNEYSPFIYATTISILSSLPIAFTLIPLATKYINPKPKNKSKIFITKYFSRILERLIKHRYIFLIGLLILGSFTFYIYNKYMSNAWVINNNQEIDLSLNVKIQLNSGSNIFFINDAIRKFENVLENNNNIEEYYTSVTPYSANLKINLKEEALRANYQNQLFYELNSIASELGCFTSNISWLDLFSNQNMEGSSHSIIYFLGYNYQKLHEICESFADYLKKLSKRINNISVDENSYYTTQSFFNYEINFDRKKLMLFNLSMAEATNLIQSKMNSSHNNINIIVNNDKRNILLKNDNKLTLNDLKCLHIKDNIQLHNIASIKRIKQSKNIYKENGNYRMGVTFDYRGSNKQSNKFMKHIIENYKVPVGFRIEDDYEDIMTKKMNLERQIVPLVICAIILVYMTLCALYESFLYPFIIIFTVPTALIGVVLTFYITGNPLDILAKMGLVLLSGIVVNNTIILVAHIKDLLKIYPLKQAIITGTCDRIRPILMTTLSTILGLSPMLLFSESTQNNFWKQLSLSTIGGLFFSTIMVLTFIPIIFYIFHKSKE